MRDIPSPPTVKSFVEYRAIPSVLVPVSQRVTNIDGTSGWDADYFELSHATEVRGRILIGDRKNPTSSPSNELQNCQIHIG
jgi:hypothetical protein